MILICWRLLITDLFWWVGDFLSQTCLDELATFYRRPVLMSWWLLIADLFWWVGDFLSQTCSDELATSYRRPVWMSWRLLIADLFWWVGDFLSQTCSDELATSYCRPIWMNWRLLIADLFWCVGDFLSQTCSYVWTAGRSSRGPAAKRRDKSRVDDYFSSIVSRVDDVSWRVDVLSDCVWHSECPFCFFYSNNLLLYDPDELLLCNLD